MTNALILLLFVYVAIKLASIALFKSPGFRRGEVRLHDRLRAREPGLFALACVIALPLAMLGTSYAQRTLTDQYAHSANCYGQILALEKVGAFRSRVGDYAFDEGVRRYASTAQVMAADLDMTADDVKRSLDGEVALSRNRYAVMERQGRTDEMARERGKAQTCLYSLPGAQRG